MAKLTEEEKTFLVCQFALYRSPLQAQQAFRDTFGREIDRRQAQNYDLDGHGGRARAGQGQGGRAEKWRPLFEETRRRFLAEAGAIPIANAAYRLRELQTMFEKVAHAESGRINVPLAASLLEQAAKEAGGLYRRERAPVKRGDGKDDAGPEEEVMTPEEKRGMLEQRVGAALERMLGARGTVAAGSPTVQ